MGKGMLLATLEMYKDCALEATQALLRNLLLVPASIAAYFIFVISARVFGSFGLVGGFILGLINIVLLSCYYSWLSECVRKNKLSGPDFVQFDYPLFSTVMNTAFVLFIASYLIQTATVGVPQAQPFVMCIGLGLFLVFNALPEVLYIQGHMGTGAFATTYRFVRDNWIEWFAPLLVLFLPVLLQGPREMLLMMSAGYPLLPVLIFTELFTLNFLSVAGGFVISSDLVVVILKLLVLFAATWFMLFRGFLFLALESGSRRQRAFRAAQR